MIEFNIVHHNLSKNGGSNITACGEPTADFQNCEKSKFIEDVTCKECLAYWDERFKASFGPQKEKRIDDGPLPV